MSKYKRLKLARGTRLAPQHIWDDGLTKVISNLNTANTAGNDAIVVSQYEKQNGTFRLNINIPYIGSDWTRANGTDKPYVIPFMLPPLQEFWNVEGISDELTPSISLTELSFGFDQRDEGGLITDQWCGRGVTAAPESWDDYIKTIIGPGVPALADWSNFFTNGNHGKVFKGEGVSPDQSVLERGSMKIHLLQKDPTYYGGTIASSVSEIYNLPIPISAIISSALKANPSIEKDLSINIDPYKTYLLGVTPFRLHDTTPTATGGANSNLALVNLTVSLKFKHTLVTRDSDIIVNHTPNNIPEHGNLKTQASVIATAPAAITTIEAETPDGLNTSTTNIDKTFRKKLKGGLSDLSDVGVVEHLCQDAGYEVIAVPLWNNQWNNQLTIKGITQNGTAPYQYGVNAAQRVDTRDNLDLKTPVCDRAVIPLSFPMTIHHVIVAHNNLCSTIVGGENETFMYHYPVAPSPANFDIGVGPTPAKVKHNIGVAIGTGCRGTFYGYKQVCSYSGDLTDYLVDDIRMNYNATTQNTSANLFFGIPDGTNTHSGISGVPEWRLNYLPIESSGNQVAPGLFDSSGVKATTTTFTNMQDTPFFAGNSFLVPDMGNAASGGTPPAFDGPSVRTDNETKANQIFAADQWLEIRWSIGPDGRRAADDWDDFDKTATSADWSRIANGYGGSWVYIIGKKHTISDQNLQRPYHKQGVNQNG